MKHFTVRTQSAGYRRSAKARPISGQILCRCFVEVPMFKSLNRIRAAFARASKRRRTMRELNELPPEIRKDIGWRQTAHDDEIRLPF
ncbi:DUF1127 domain-containing protein [Mesorhizobium captivum]|uniref:DUF1127 domain-containing protein n=1 Tax=Mesorhizobium captivum TaxID=3072319 RepID=UPI002A242E61|nr:DUF1127 domain-containing protein [Mesorhizobium sp. VK3C]MDX8450556.1 DUF1127 domain-containing protein [Mesorhizobium sp. VK3C]